MQVGDGEAEDKLSWSRVEREMSSQAGGTGGDRFWKHREARPS